MILNYGLNEFEIKTAIAEYVAKVSKNAVVAKNVTLSVSPVYDFRDMPSGGTVTATVKVEVSDEKVL